MVVVSPTRASTAGTPARSTAATLSSTERRCRYIAQRAPLLLRPAPAAFARRSALVIAGPGARHAGAPLRFLYLDHGCPRR